MNRKEAERQTMQAARLRSLGLTSEEAETLRRASLALSTWAEHECNGTIQRDEETGRPYWYSPVTGNRLGPTSDREAGALRRAGEIAERHGLGLYHQTDPRGCALYLLRPGDVPDGTDPSRCYSNGVGVY